MQLLFEEFFSKVFRVINSFSFSIRVIIKFLFYLLVMFMIFFAVYYIHQGKYIIISVVTGIIILAEIAHYIRKSMERTIVEKVTEENIVKKETQDILNPKKAKNKDMLDVSKPKNKDLLDKKSGNRSVK